MQVITDQTIDLINDRIQRMDETQIGKVWDSFAKEQPALVGYVLGESRELEMPDAREDVAYVLTIILLSFQELTPGIPAVTEAEFEKAFNEEFDEMEAVFQDGFDETDAMAVIESFCQPDLLQFAAATIYSEDADEDSEESNFTEEEAGLFIVIFKTAIALLHKKSGSII
jgi:hypothetical protein